MTAYRLERTQLIPGDLDSVFAFFKSPGNLETITPPWLLFQMLSASDAEMRQGTRITYRLRWQIFPMRWESVIAEYEEGVRFADEMVRGPYRSWYHRHLFRAMPGGVEMRDQVDYELPFGPLGSIAHRAIVRRQLEAIFDYRAKTIARLFEQSGP